MHWLTAYTLFRAGERGEHSRIAADRFVTAARRVGDPLLMGASARCLGHVLLHSGQAEAARAVIREALDALAPDVGAAGDDHSSVYGALLLAEARLGDSAGCRRLLREAEKPARRVDDVAAFDAAGAAPLGRLFDQAAAAGLPEKCAGFLGVEHGQPGDGPVA